MQVSKDISNHPEIESIERTAHLKSFSVDKTRKEIVIDLLIKHYYINNDGDRTYASTVKDVSTKLRANNSTKVNLSGDILQPGDQGYDSALGEFDFFEQFPIQQGTLSGSIYPIIEQYIARSDTRDRFNKNIYL